MLLWLREAGLPTSGLGRLLFGRAFRGSFFLVVPFVVRALGSFFLVVLFVVRSLGSSFGGSCVFFRCF